MWFRIMDLYAMGKALLKMWQACLCWIWLYMCLFGKCLVLGISMVEIGRVHIWGVDLVWEWSCLEMAVFGSGTAWTCQPLGKALYMRFFVWGRARFVFVFIAFRSAFQHQKHMT